MKGKGRAQASLYACVSVVFWGISFVSTKAALEQLQPIEIIFIRFGIAAIFLFLFILFTKKDLSVRIRHLPYFAIIGAIGIFIHQMVQAAALETIEASAAGWLISLSPIFTGLLSAVFLKEKFTHVKVIGLLFALMGVFLITVKGENPFQFQTGYLLMILSTVNWAVYSILLKMIKLPYSVLTTTFYITLSGFLLILPFYFRTSQIGKLGDLSTHTWGHALFLGIFVSAIAYWFWGKALSVLEATEVSVFLYMEPAATMLAAFYMLNEKLELRAAFGGLLILFGVLIVNGHEQLLIRWRPFIKK